MSQSRKPTTTTTDTGSQSTQFWGGLAAATYHALTGKKWVDSIEHTHPVRQDFHDALEELKKDEHIRQSGEAQRQLSLQQGQNNFQTSVKQPMPKETVPHFIAQVKAHANVDAVAREKSKPQASEKKHAKIDQEFHSKLSQVFDEADYTSGKYLHQIGHFSAVNREKSYYALKGKSATELNYETAKDHITWYGQG